MTLGLADLGFLGGLSFDGPFQLATGGDSVADIDVAGQIYRVHTFSTVGASTFTVVDPGIFQYLVIAGGGGGGSFRGGGGGAGGYRCSVPGELTGGGGPAESPLTLPAGVYAVTVGAGGTGGPSGGGASGSDGGNSTFDTITAIGGGGGQPLVIGAAAAAGRTGGSGGGGGGSTVTLGTGGVRTASPVQGFNGGNGYRATEPYNGGGGGGAGSVGEVTTGESTYANGGTGLASSITGVSLFRGGGGGSGAWNGIFNALRNSGLGGNGGGGNGGQDSTGGLLRAPTAGSANTGGGGGGGRNSGPNPGADGGSGIVIIRYRIA